MATHFRQSFIVAFTTLSLSLAIISEARILLQERPLMPAEFPEPGFPLLPKFPMPGFFEHHPQLRFPPYPIIPPFLKPGFHTYLPKLPELPALPGLPGLPSLPKMPELPSTPNPFTPIPGLPEGDSKKVEP